MQGFIVGPTEKPALDPERSKSTLFTKNDFPVRYLPTIQITANFLFGFRERKYCSASGLSLKPSFWE